MNPSDHVSKYAIVRNYVSQDVLGFGIPAFIVFVTGLVVSARDGYDGLLKTIWNLILTPEDIYLLSIWNVVGLVFCVVGFAIAFVAVFTLGRFYSSSLVIRKDHRLVRHGPYRFTRHPIYFGILLVLFGVPAYPPSLNGLLVMSILVPIVLCRITREEKMLIEEFGDEYWRYQKTTSKLIPFLY